MMYNNSSADLDRGIVSITFDQWLSNYDNLTDDCEEYMERHYGDKVMSEACWENLMDYECSRHPEWSEDC